MKAMRRAVMLVAAGLLGSTAAALAVPANAEAFSCELNACFTNTGNCDLTDIAVSCRETAGGCQSTSCFPSQT